MTLLLPKDWALSVHRLTLSPVLNASHKTAGWDVCKLKLNDGPWPTIWRPDGGTERQLLGCSGHSGVRMEGRRDDGLWLERAISVQCRRNVLVLNLVIDASDSAKRQFCDGIFAGTVLWGCL